MKTKTKNILLAIAAVTAILLIIKNNNKLSDLKNRLRMN